MGQTYRLSLLAHKGYKHALWLSDESAQYDGIVVDFRIQLMRMLKSIQEMPAESKAGAIMRELKKAGLGQSLSLREKAELKDKRLDLRPGRSVWKITRLGPDDRIEVIPGETAEKFKGKTGKLGFLLEVLDTSISLLKGSKEHSRASFALRRIAKILESHSKISELTSAEIAEIRNKITTLEHDGKDIAVTASAVILKKFLPKLPHAQKQ